MGEHGAGEGATVLVRPEQIVADSQSAVRATVRSVQFNGPDVIVVLVPDGVPVERDHGTGDDDTADEDSVQVRWPTAE
ncbi:MAG TPA: TOBE domain-containing protein, partial [Ilumatobacteraceae bacterium]|nr:TOBE domain-containing protein [Ilumatobacteraceae bacterium]